MHTDESIEKAQHLLEGLCPYCKQPFNICIAEECYIDVSSYKQMELDLFLFNREQREKKYGRT